MKKLYILLLLTMSILGAFTIGLQANASTEETKIKVEEMAEYIGNHLSEFKTAYKSENGNSLHANRVESYGSVYIIDAKEDGFYIDFDGENGYLVSTFSLELYALEVEGDISYLEGISSISYSVIDGFLYNDGTTYHKWNGIETYSQKEMVYGYAGQLATGGEAGIYNLNAYISDRYPSYKHEETHRIAADAYTCFYTAFNLSTYLYYSSTDNGQTFTPQGEQNCALVASFNVLASWKETGFTPKLPTKDTERDFYETVASDSIYHTYGVGYPSACITAYWTLNSEYNLRHTPEIYYWVRYFAVDRYGYKPDKGCTLSQAQDALCTAAAYFSSYHYCPEATTFAEVMPSLDEGKAVFMGVGNSQTFSGDHAVALLGYYKYSYTTGAWIFKQNHTAYFFIIDDGLREALTFFDPNANSKLSFEFLYPDN